MAVVIVLGRRNERKTMTTTKTFSLSLFFLYNGRGIVLNAGFVTYAASGGHGGSPIAGFGTDDASGGHGGGLNAVFGADNTSGRHGCGEG